MRSVSGTRRLLKWVGNGLLVVMLGFLSGSLLQPHSLLLAWLLTAVWARE